MTADWVVCVSCSRSLATSGRLSNLLGSMTLVRLIVMTAVSLRPVYRCR